MTFRVTRSRIVVLVVLLACAAPAACARERVEIADIEAEPTSAPQPPAFAPADGSVRAVSDGAADATDAAVNCSRDVPPIANCSPCPTGYVIDDAGRRTCDCCE